MLAHIDGELASKVGPHSLEYLSLDSVIEHVPLDTSYRQRRWFSFFT
jgi:hypothetical protein